MPYSIIYGTPDAITERLNGYLRLGRLVPAEGLAIGGLTLIFTTPSATTVTFGGAVGSMRTPAQIKSDIEAQLAGTTVRLVTADAGAGASGVAARHILLQHASGFVIANTGTANTALRLDTTNATSVLPIAQAKIVGFGPENLTARFFVLIAP